MPELFLILDQYLFALAKKDKKLVDWAKFQEFLWSRPDLDKYVVNDLHAYVN